MKCAFAIVLITALLSQTGCAAIAEALVSAIIDRDESKAGTSSDKSLPKEQRRILFEEEFRGWIKDNEEERRREQYSREQRRGQPAEWERSIDNAF